MLGTVLLEGQRAFDRYIADNRSRCPQRISVCPGCTTDPVVNRRGTRGLFHVVCLRVLPARRCSKSPVRRSSSLIHSCTGMQGKQIRRCREQVLARDRRFTRPLANNCKQRIRHRASWIVRPSSRPGRPKMGPRVEKAYVISMSLGAVATGSLHLLNTPRCLGLIVHLSIKCSSGMSITKRIAGCDPSFVPIGNQCLSFEADDGRRSSLTTECPWVSKTASRCSNGHGVPYCSEFFFRFHKCIDEPGIELGVFSLADHGAGRFVREGLLVTSLRGECVVDVGDRHYPR
jgi:hypothetical protein